MNNILTLNNNLKIHPTAIISPTAELGANVSIGPYCCIGDKVKLGDNVHLMSHVVINGNTTIGSHTIIYPFACLGDPPQDKSYHGEDSQLVIGSHNRIGHYVTINGGTEHGGLVTKIGNYNYFMDGSHIGHDSQVSDYVVLTNHVLIAGHVVIDDYVTIGGGKKVKQHIRIGRGAMISGAVGLGDDVIPYGYVFPFSDRGFLRGLNILGMKRLRIPENKILEARRAYRQIFQGHNLFNESLVSTKLEFNDNEIVQEIIKFIEHRGKNSICKPEIKNFQ